MSDNLRKLALAMVIAVAMPAAPSLAGEATTYAVLHSGEPALAPDQGRIYFYREGGILGAALQPTIMINGESAGARAKPGDYFYIDRPAGNYEVSTTTEKTESTNVAVTAGQSVYVRFNVSMGLFVGHVLPSVIPPEEAADEIKDCDYRAPKPDAAPSAAPSADAAPKADADPKTDSGK
jgi:hypothetical protein